MSKRYFPKGDFEQRIGALEETLGTLISWIAQSSVSPISVSEAETLIAKLQNEDEANVE